MESILFHQNANEEYLEFEEEAVYNQALTTVRLMNELMKLRKENEYLKKKLKEHNDEMNQQYRDNIKWAGNMLSNLIEKADGY